MTTDLEKKTEEQVARPLRVLVLLIKDDLENGRAAAERAGIPYYRAAGEKLIEAKAQMKHGEFMPWIKRNFGVSDRQARTYMALAQHLKTQSGTAIPLSLGDFKRSTGERDPEDVGKPLWQKPVQAVLGRVDTETLNLKRDEMKRADEREAQRKLTLQMIEIGYKVLARTLHPDKGGSREAMSRLNAARDRIKQYA